MQEQSTSEKVETGSSQTEPAKAWETSPSNTRVNLRTLLEECLRYLRREGHTVPGIGAKVVEQIIDGKKIETLEGPEQDRYKLAEKIQTILLLPDPVAKMLNEIKGELKTAADFGKFDNCRGDDCTEYPEKIAISIMKEIAKKYGVEL